MHGRAVALLASAAAPYLSRGYRANIAIGSQAHEQADEQQQPQPTCPSGYTETSRTLNVLYARTGLSCANALTSLASATWSVFQPSTDMVDPLLTSSGAHASLQQSHEIQRYLQTSNLKIDAVLSSSLARAIETALLQFRGHEVWAVPYAVGKSRFGVGQKDFPRQAEVIHSQLKEGKLLNETSGVRAGVNEQWLQALGRAQGSPELFEKFLAESFLPSLELEPNRPNSDPITLAVVTHRNFMSELKGCKGFFQYDGRRKPGQAHLNEVVHKVYHFKTRVPAQDCVDATPQYELTTSGEECHPLPSANAGERLYQPDSDRLVDHCRRDVGQLCLKVAEVRGLQLPATVVEEELDRLWQALKSKWARVGDAMISLEDAKNALASYDPAKDSWWNPLRSTKESLQRGVAVAQQHLQLMRDGHRRLQESLAELKKRPCLDGLPPQWAEPPY